VRAWPWNGVRMDNLTNKRIANCPSASLLCKQLISCLLS
jgi:hypothetical protein